LCNLLENNLMKTLIYIFLALATGLLIFNVFHIDFDAPLEGDSFAAVIGVGASLCAVVLLVILQVALRIQKKVKNHS
jgi:hypothetical protein